MALESLRTGLEVNAHSGELVVNFRNFGDVVFPNWKNWFVTGILGRERDKGEEREERNSKYAEACLEANKLEDFYEQRAIKLETRLKNAYWWVFGVKAPVQSRERLSDTFVKGNYTKQATWNFPGNVVTLEDGLVELLEKRIELNTRLERIRQQIEIGRSENSATKLFNDLNDFFDNSYQGRIKLKTLDKRIVEERRQIAEEISKINERLGSVGRIEYPRISSNEKVREREMKVVQSNWGYLKRARNLSSEEIFKMKAVFLDIEIPYFRRKDSQVSWVGVTYVENGKIVKKEIHTLHNTQEEVDGFKIIRSRSESELVERLTADINRENPDIVSTYNTRFDLIKLRETDEELLIGGKKTNPLFKTTTRFFERIGVRNRLVFDMMRDAGIARRYEINKKLETIAGFEKEIDYDELEQLEEQSFSGNKQAATQIAKYLASDVNRLVQLYQADSFKKDIEDVCWLSKRFGVSIERLLHSPNCINDSQERAYFLKLGVYREYVPPHMRTTSMEEIRAKVKQDLSEKIIEDMIMPGEVKGLVKNVYKVFVPTGKNLTEKVVARRFPDVRDLEDYIKKFSDDKQRTFFLEQFRTQLTRWIREDYGIYLKAIKDLDSMLKGIDNTAFEDAYHLFRENLEKTNYPGLRKLNDGKLTVDAAKKSVTDNIRVFMARFGMDEREFTKLANQRSNVKRKGVNIHGNYDVYTDRRFFVPEKHIREGEDVVVLEDIFNDDYKRVNDFIKNNHLQIVAREGSYLYLKGDKKALEKTDAPVILVDEIPELYHADSAYYKKFGFYSHIKIKEEPDVRLCMFEMQLYKKMLDNLLEGNVDEARKDLRKSLDSLKEKNSWREFLFYNKSKERYSVLSRGGRFYYALSAPKDAKIENDERGEYFMDEERGKPLRVYVNPSDIPAPNTQEYRQRILKKAKDLLKPVGGVPLDLLEHDQVIGNERVFQAELGL
jgi:hypothetical protein